jgi:maltose O-acetyltransferase
VGKNVFMGPGVICTDDKHPKIHRPGEPPYRAQPPIIGDDAAIGAAVIILPGIKIGVGARVAAGSIVTKDVPNYTCVRGGPAKFVDLPMDHEWNPLKLLGGQ